VAVSGSDGSYNNSGKIVYTCFGKMSLADGNPMKAVNQLNINLGKPILSTLLILSFATYNPNPFPLRDALISEYYKMICSAFPQINCTIDSKQMNMDQALNQTEI
jgi:hypothetical protein